MMWRTLKTMIGLAVTIAAAVAVTVGGLAILGRSGVQTWTTSGRSMEPTYHDGDVMIGRETRSPRPGDVIVVSRPDGWRDGHGGRPDIVKRVIATGGMVICVHADGRIYDSCDDHARLIDSREDSYGAGCAAGGQEEIRVPYGEMFVRGDNVNISYDSRHAVCVGESPFVDVGSVKMRVDWSVPFGWLTSRLTPRGSDGGVK